jgi:hypothetical protein
MASAGLPRGRRAPPALTGCWPLDRALWSQRGPTIRAPISRRTRSRLRSAETPASFAETGAVATLMPVVATTEIEPVLSTARGQAACSAGLSTACNPTEVSPRLSAVRTRRHRNTDDSDLRARVEALETGLQDALRETAELHAAHDEAIELALATAVPNGIFRLALEAKSQGWVLTYGRSTRPVAHGTINFEHPQDPTHNCSIELPVSQDEHVQRQIEAEVRMRIGLLRAA